MSHGQKNVCIDQLEKPVKQVSFREQSLSMTGRGAEEIWMGYEIFLRVFVGV